MASNIIEIPRVNSDAGEAMLTCHSAVPRRDSSLVVGGDGLPYQHVIIGYNICHCRVSNKTPRPAKRPRSDNRRVPTGEIFADAMSKLPSANRRRALVVLGAQQPPDDISCGNHGASASAPKMMLGRQQRLCRYRRHHGRQMASASGLRVVAGDLISPRHDGLPSAIEWRPGARHISRLGGAKRSERFKRLRRRLYLNSEISSAAIMLPYRFHDFRRHDDGGAGEYDPSRIIAIFAGVPSPLLAMNGHHEATMLSKICAGFPGIISAGG